jgi:predicted flap endonuclease-1-like 5' DNA nuclease
MRASRGGWFVLLLALIGGGAAWAIRLFRDDQDWTQVPERTAPIRATTPADEAPAAAPATESEPDTASDTASDNLSRIEGIGPKIASALQSAGLRTYRAVADASDDELREALTTAGMRFAPSLPTWARQAALLADGDEAGFVELTARLSGGREV